MLRMMQSIRSAAPLRMVVFQGFARAGIAVLLMSCIAHTVSAQLFDEPAQPGSNSAAIEPASDAPPRSIIQRYTPVTPRPLRGEMSLLVDAPPSSGAPNQAVSSSATGGDVVIGDRVDGPAINALATGRSAITVTVNGGRRQ